MRRFAPPGPLWSFPADDLKDVAECVAPEDANSLLEYLAMCSRIATGIVTSPETLHPSRPVELAWIKLLGAPLLYARVCRVFGTSPRDLRFLGGPFYHPLDPRAPYGNTLLLRARLWPDRQPSGTAFPTLGEFLETDEKAFEEAVTPRGDQAFERIQPEVFIQVVPLPHSRLVLRQAFDRLGDAVDVLHADFALRFQDSANAVVDVIKLLCMTLPPSFLDRIGPLSDRMQSVYNRVCLYPEIVNTLTARKMLIERTDQQAQNAWNAYCEVYWGEELGGDGEWD